MREEKGRGLLAHIRSAGGEPRAGREVAADFGVLAAHRLCKGTEQQPSHERISKHPWLESVERGRREPEDSRQPEPRNRTASERNRGSSPPTWVAGRFLSTSAAAAANSANSSVQRREGNTYGEAGSEARVSTATAVESKGGRTHRCEPCHIGPQRWSAHKARNTFSLVSQAPRNKPGVK